MVFNWFRRQFSEQEQTDTAPSEGENASAQPSADASSPSSEQANAAPADSAENPETTTGSDSDTTEVAVDYLQWAKAAYQNVQSQQASLAEEIPETAVEEAEQTEATADVADVAAEEADEAAETAVPETPAALPETAPESVPESGAALEETATPETVPDSTADLDSASPDAAAREAEAETGLAEAALAPATETDAAESEGESASKAVPETEPETTETEATEAPPLAPTSPPEALPEPLATEVVGDSAPEVAEPITEAISAEATSAEDRLAEPSPPPIAPPPVAAETPATISADEPDSASAATETSLDESATSEVTAPVPFWAAAEADRAARLERLKATAIETPEELTPAPVSSSEAATAEAADSPAIAFDESFLWSAEVLASQGRRPEDISIEEITWLQKLRQGLDKTRRNILNQLKSIVGQGPLNQDAVMEIEALLLQSDVGVEATDFIIEALQEKLRQEALPPEEAIAYLKSILRDMLDRPYSAENAAYSPTFAPEKDALNIWLMTGVNGAGKTTTIGKIAHLAKKSDYRCLIAAADTFRAAAVEQVKIWGQRSEVEVIANPGQNTDPAAVVFDAIAAANSRNIELLLVDTAGRLQNKKNLMDELGKIRRIIDKKAPDATIQSLLVLDATLGQNGLRQAEVFAEAAKLSGVVLTKLDGTAKGGVALAVVQQLGLPIRFIGAGEGIEDLRPFSSYEFVEALLNG